MSVRLPTCVRQNFMNVLSHQYIAHSVLYVASRAVATIAAWGKGPKPSEQSVWPRPPPQQNIWEIKIWWYLYDELVETNKCKMYFVKFQGLRLWTPFYLIIKSIIIYLKSTKSNLALRYPRPIILQTSLHKLKNNSRGCRWWAEK